MEDGMPVVLGEVAGMDNGSLGMEVRNSKNYRLCCPECGYDLLKIDVVDVLAKETVRVSVPEKNTNTWSRNVINDELKNKTIIMI